MPMLERTSAVRDRPIEPAAAPVSGLRRLAYVLAGGSCVALGVVGVLLPGLPTTVFLLAAAWLFARSSPRLYRRLLLQRHLGVYLRAAEDRAMPPRCKAAALAAMWAGTGFACFILGERFPHAAATLVALALLGSVVVLFWVRTRGTPAGDSEVLEPVAGGLARVPILVPSSDARDPRESP
jgi:uncharacterized membrane protein YbaN (DUF454 family)